MTLSAWACVICSILVAAPAAAPDQVAPHLAMVAKATELRDRELAALGPDDRDERTRASLHWIERMTDAEEAAVGSGNYEDGQRIFEEVQAARRQLPVELPPPAGRGRPKASLDFFIQVSDFNGAAGLTKIAQLTPQRVGVRMENDFGRPPKDLWEAPLAPDQRQRLETFLSKLPVQKLRTKYVNPNVFDGYQVTFRLRIGDQAPREVFIGNARQRELEALVGELNRILPPKHQLSRMGADTPSSVHRAVR